MVLLFKDFQNKDYAELENMILALYKEDPDGEAMNKNKISETIATLSTSPEKGKILIFKYDDEIVGCATLAFCWNTEYGGNFLIIEDLYVKPQWRNQGISTVFFNYLVETYQSTSVALKLEVSPSNIYAQTFYSKLGFVPSHNMHMIREFKI